MYLTQKIQRFWLLAALAIASPVTSFAANPDPVFRFYNAQTQKHFYTISAEEANSLNSSWQSEGIGFYAYKNQQVNTVPVYRFRRYSNNAHVFVAEGPESVQLKYDSAFKYEGVKFWVPRSTSSDTQPLYRLWSPGRHSHFYTTSLYERIQAENQDGFDASQTTTAFLVLKEPRRIGPVPFYTIVTTADKNYPGQDAWVKETNTGKKFWISAQCRTELVGRSAEIIVLSWSVINAMPNRQSISCSEICVAQFCSGPEPREYEIIITGDKVAPGYDGWIRTQGKKFWISGQCRSQAQSRGLTPIVLPWSTIRDTPDRPSVSCDQIR